MLVGLCPWYLPLLFEGSFPPPPSKASDPQACDSEVC